MPTYVKQKTTATNYTLLISCCLLIVLFVYTGLIKLIEVSEFERSIKLQPLPQLMKKLLIAGLPAAEIIIALLLAFSKSRLAGLYSSICLLTFFTIYSVIVVSGLFKNVPCACMGFVKDLNWAEHIVFNSFFLAVGFVGLYAWKRSYE